MLLTGVKTYGSRNEIYEIDHYVSTSQTKSKPVWTYFTDEVNVIILQLLLVVKICS